MINEEEDIELIEKYFNKTLSSQEVEQFDIRFKADAAFAAMVDDYKDIIQGVRLAAQEDFQRDVTTWETELKNQEQTIRPLWWNPYLSIAAGLLILFVAGLYFFYPKDNNNTDQLFTAYFTPYEDVVSVRGDNQQITLSEALVFYNNGEYNKAADLFESYLKEQPNNASALLYKGISELTMNDADKAIRTFKKVTTLESIFKEQAEWYLTLSYLKAGDQQTTFTLAKKIADQPHHDYQTKASALMKQLN